MTQIIQQLNQLPFAGLMLVVTLGYLLGRPGWRGISLGPAGGTLFVGLLAGHLGLSFDRLYGEGVDSLATVGGFGFCLFIYSVGFDAGSGFFGTLRSGRGLRMVTVGVVVNLLAILVDVVPDDHGPGGKETLHLPKAALREVVEHLDTDLDESVPDGIIASVDDHDPFLHHQQWLSQGHRAGQGVSLRACR